MLPYLIAGVIGYGISKLFDDNKAPKYNDGGLIAPNGKPSNLTPEQYKLVRTPAFKEWFGDWENDPANASKVVDENGEPLPVYHGTLQGEFTIFNMGKIPDEYWDSFYGSNFRSGADPTAFLGSHFAKEKSVAEMFFKGIYSHSGDKPKLYECFLNLRNIQIIDELKLQENLENQDMSFHWSLDREFENAEDFYGVDSDTLFAEYNEKDKVKKEINTNILGQNHSDSISLANAMAEQYRNELIKQKIYGIEYLNRKEGGTSFVAFYPEQIKLADGTNTTFDSNNPDIRFKRGGNLK